MQLLWPTSALLVLYSCVVGQLVQAVSPSSEYLPAAQVLQTMLAVALHDEAPSQTLPAAHAFVAEQAVQGARPVELQFVPATQGNAHVLLAVFQA